MKLDNEYDVIVAGAGVAGTLAAAAAAKGGANVLLIDKNSVEEPGKKTNWGWTCGDAVAKSHLDFINKKIGVSFSEPELDHKVDGVYAISPDLKKKFLFEGEGYSLDRPKFARKLLAIAQKAGAKYVSDHFVDGPILEDNKVVGVYGRNTENNAYQVRAKIVIDALGISSMLRRKLPENPYVDREISHDDIETTGRYIADFEVGNDDLAYYDPKNALIHLNQEMSPGGYCWIFPRARNKINIGLGVEKKSLDIRNKKMSKTDTLHSLIDKYIEWNPAVKNMKIYDEDKNGKGYWSVPVRRQLDSLVYYGYMGAGDSMAMPNPISAGGIGPAMVGGLLAGEVAAKAVQEKDISLGSLWRYNTEYNREYGNKTAGLEVFRVYLQSLNNDQINYGMHHFLTDKEAVDISYGLVPELSLGQTFNKILHGVANINAFKNLIFVVRRMKELNALYAAYPKSPAEFMPWKEKVGSSMHEVKERFKPNPI